MKVCSLYGAGFFYIPGTDTCLKLGGYIRAEWNHNAGGSLNTHLGGSSTAANTREPDYNRATNSLTSRSRLLTTWDIRSQTEYGTLRAYARAGWTYSLGTRTADPVGLREVYMDRAFIQFAGFTFGMTQSFFDVPDISDMSHQTEYSRNVTGGDGINVAAYTAMLGNGVTATVSIEDTTFRRKSIVDLSTATLRAATFAVGVGNAGDAHGNETPDIIGNLRVDQAWGSAQVSGALHLNQAQYYGTPALNSGQQGHPDEKWGWAVGAGILLKMPWDAKDTFALAATYGEGANAFVAKGANGGIYGAGGVALAHIDDAYFGPLGELELANMWNVNAGFQHYWTNSLRSSIWGSYSSYEANSNTVNTLICAPRGFGANCADFNVYQIGSRTIWNPVTNLDIGLEVIYSKIETSFDGGIAGVGGTVPTANVVDPSKRVNDQDVWSGIFRVQRNFWP